MIELIALASPSRKCWKAGAQWRKWCGLAIRDINYLPPISFIVKLWPSVRWILESYVCSRPSTVAGEMEWDPDLPVWQTVPDGVLSHVS